MVSQGPVDVQRPSSRLRNEVNNTQYKKLLELMLDLERKTDRRFVDWERDMKNGLLKAFDVSQIRKDIDQNVEDKIGHIENRFDQVFQERTDQIEEILDQQIQSLKSVII